MEQFSERDLNRFNPVKQVNEAGEDGYHPGQGSVEENEACGQDDIILSGQDDIILVKFQTHY